ncbi:uncharacterized protein LOC131672018 isoform X2 [Phymastichus coffea]|uniref:uncharacterized protein LOC131672018 isoform X2 n=1 Tax=Phymastichus coffea TaxID=108790 RepID=UPI00273B23C5|nr:uncharacterized protein LOC131672018 isoform X2 [Phymastichus coffea]
MATKMQEISFQLMKSPRELASWNFPLSKILDEYSALLPEAGKIHYGEVALVIQNSVNAYVRRLEELYDETRCFNTKLIDRKGENESTCFFRQEADKNNIIDFTPFKLLDFQEVGRNTNSKFQNRKTVNFLHSCFTQLENLNDRSYINLQDIHNELIGKKYDYRCNQRISKCGNLVDEFNSDDFGNNCKLIDISIAKSKNNSIIDNPLIHLTSGATTDHNISPNKYVSFLNGSTASNLYKNIPIEERENIEFMPISNSTIYSCMINIPTFKSFPSPCCNANNVKITSSQITGKSSNKMNIEISKNNTDQEGIGGHLKKCGDSYFDVNNQQMDSFKQSYLDKNYKRTSILNSDTLNLKTGIILRRSKRIMYKNKDKSVLKENKKHKLKPISFTSGIPNKVGKSRIKFRFPCNRKLLIGNLTFKNKKYSKAIEKNTEFVNTDNDLSITEYDNMVHKVQNITRDTSSIKGYSEVDQLYGKNTCFTKKRTIKYNPVTTIKMDLLGFELNIDKCVKSLDQSLYAPYQNNLISLPEYSLHSGHNATLVSPLSKLSLSLKHNTDNQINIDELYSNGIEVVIKEKIKEIYKKLDLLTEEDKKIAKWHEELKPKLREAEHKPPFFIHEYEARIIQKLRKSNRRVDFNEMMSKESFSEIARFFSATLQLLSISIISSNWIVDIKRCGKL